MVEKEAVLEMLRGSFAYAAEVLPTLDDLDAEVATWGFPASKRGYLLILQSHAPRAPRADDRLRARARRHATVEAASVSPRRRRRSLRSKATPPGRPSTRSRPLWQSADDVRSAGPGAAGHRARRPGGARSLRRLRHGSLRQRALRCASGRMGRLRGAGRPADDRHQLRAAPPRRSAARPATPRRCDQPADPRRTAAPRPPKASAWPAAPAEF